MSATKVKARLKGLEARFPVGIRVLNRQWLEHPLTNKGMGKLGAMIPGYRQTAHHMRTDDGYLWIDRLTIRGTLTHGRTVEILFPSSRYNPKTTKLSLMRSIAFYAPADVFDSDLQILFIVLQLRYNNYLEYLEWVHGRA